MYLIVSVDCISFDHTLFIILYSAIFAASMSINVQYSVFSMYVIDTQTDVRQHHRLMPPHRGGRA